MLPRVTISSEDQPGASDSRASSFVRIAALAAAIRLVVVLLSIGSNDAVLWHRLGREVWTTSWPDVWRDPWMNNPLIPSMYAGLMYGLVGDRLYAYSILMKLPSILAEAVATLLVGRIVSSRTASLSRSRFAAIAYALNPAAILVSGYHGNIDATLAMFTLLAFWLASQGRFGWAGLAAGAAVNCKIAAGPAAILLLACARSPRQGIAALGGLALAAVPFAIAFLIIGRPFYHSLFLYRPPGDYWLMLIPEELGRLNILAGPMRELSRLHFKSVVKFALLLVIVIAWWWRRRGWKRADLLTVGALFWTSLLLWIGGSLQYVIWPLPLLAATRPRIALVFGIAASVWLVWTYVDAGVSLWPLQSWLDDPITRSRFATPLPVIMLAITVVSLTRGRREARHVAE